MKEKNQIITVLIIGAFFFFAFQKTEKPIVNELSFMEAHDDFIKKQKNLRKWDAPVVADLDQDGFPDLILNDHGLGVSISWNNNGKFAQPYDLIMGDLHGISVGDFDMDGNLEIIISRGGGSGSNARNSKIFRVDKERIFSALPDFNVPLELMRGRTVKFMDGDNDGDLDLLNFAFPDKEKKGESENYIYENDGKGQLILSSVLPPSKMDGQKTLITDFNNDGIFDLFLYGGEKVKVFKGKGNLNYEEATNKTLPCDIKTVSGIVELDYDNDGDFDLFFTRGQEFQASENFYDPETKTWGFLSKRGKSNFEDMEIGDVLNIENFQSQWPFNDAFYIGETGYEYEFPSETHSGKNIRLVNSNALGFPDILNVKGGIHIGYVGNQKWRLVVDTWSPSTGVFHGVLSYPTSEHPKGLNDILLENKNGQFVDVTKKANLFFEEHTTSAAVADFDNNGFADLIIIRRGDLIHGNKSLIYLNNGELGFTKINQHNIVSPELGAIGLGAETFDYNLDGKMDVILGNERGKWHLFKNNMQATENANYLIVEVGNSPSKKASGLGALVSIKFCNKKQVKRVGATGANYSLGLNHFVHFGLSTCSGPLEVKVVWTNGETLEQKVADLNGNYVSLGMFD